jgi:hypothetical protein
VTAPLPGVNLPPHRAHSKTVSISCISNGMTRLQCGQVVVGMVSLSLSRGIGRRPGVARSLSSSRVLGGIRLDEADRRKFIRASNGVLQVCLT